jgi:tetratricopeptide (TPR) repeat protein
MPFVKRKDAKGSQPPADARKIFVGRTNELHFFIEHVLRPEEPSYNIISIAGHGGVGKSTLLAKFIEDVHTPEFKEYCLAALVDERHITPANMMEKFAEQLQMAGEFKKALTRFKEVQRKLPAEQEAMRLQDTVLHRTPDFAGAAFEGVPLVGGILRESVKLAAGHFINEYEASQAQKDAKVLDDPIGELTKAFIEELNGSANTRVTLSSSGLKRERRVILFFDTFEQLASEATPWLLDHFLEANISGNVVLVMAGRLPIERSTVDGPRRWLHYSDEHIIHSITLNSFTQEETRAYLEQRGITDAARIDTTWRLSRGLPLYLSLLTYNPQGDVDPTADVVENFLQWIPEKEVVKRRLALDAALFSRPFNQDDLGAFPYIPRNEQASLYRWLIKQPFVRSSLQDGRYSYHELAQDLFTRHLYQLSPLGSQTTRKALANHYQQLLEHIVAEEGKKAYDTDEWLELTLALAYQLILLPGESNHIQAIEQILNAYEHTKQVGEIMLVVREVLHEQSRYQSSSSSRESARQLSQYIEGDRLNQDFLAAAHYLLEKVAHEPGFSRELLASIYHKRGISYRLLGEYRRAIEDFDQALALSPEDAYIYGSRGVAYSYSEDYQQALRDFNRVLELDPQSAWSYASRGKTYHFLKGYQQALEDFDRALALNPNYAWTYANRGKTYFALKEYQKAIEDYDRAIGLWPSYTWAYARRGETYRLLNEYQKAITNFDRAITLDPTYAWTYAERGRVYRLIKEYQRALADYDQALALDAQNAQAYAGRGETYRLLKEYEKALRDFERALALYPMDGWAYGRRGMIYATLKEYEKALVNFDRAIELTPAYAATYGRRGSVYLRLNKLKEAQADYNRCWELDPKDIRAAWRAEWCGICLEKKNIALERRQRLETIAKIAAQQHIAHLCRGVALWLAGGYELSLAEVEMSIAIQPEMWDGYFWRAMAYAGAGWEREAFEVLEQAREAGLPGALLAPLEWLEEIKPGFRVRYAAWKEK